MIYFDFCKAFDSVPHGRLLLKLKAYDVNGNLLSWICCFLSHRKQHVMVNGHFSEFKDVTSGVKGVSRIFIMGFPLVRNYRNIFGISSDQLLIIYISLAYMQKSRYVSIYVYHKQVCKEPSVCLF